MSIQPIGPDDLEQFTLTTNPRREFSSGSNGITGSVNLFARRSDYEKEVQPLSAFSDSVRNDQNLQTLLLDAQRSTGSNISDKIESYLSGVNAQSVSARKQKKLEVIRFEPSFKFTSDTQRKNVILNTLYPYYRPISPSMHWSYTNYHSLNFFTSSQVPSDTVLLYPNSASNASNSTVSGTYVTRGPFTFEFYINPRYTTDDPGQEFKAGTILHLSSTFALSLVTGSSIDETDKPNAFRLMLQLSHSADQAPSTVSLSNPLSGSGLRDLIFLSDNNSLKKGYWHHCSIRWGTNNVNNGTGSFIIDGLEAGTFVIPSSTIAPAPYEAVGNPDVLCVGNFYEGSNDGIDAQSLFFNQNIGAREGLSVLVNDGDISTNTPNNFKFDHPLNAEIHELKIYSSYRNDEEISNSMTRGTLNTSSMLFYVPPFFIKEAPNKRPFGTNQDLTLIGGVLQTPFFGINGSTEDPFNVALSFGVGGRLINLDNFTRDFITGQYPRLLHLTASQIGNTTQTARSANEFLYETGSIRKANATILPCDNGRFIPEFGLLSSGSIFQQPESGSDTDRFINDLGNSDFSIIKLRDMISTGALFDGLIFDSGSFFEGIAGASPEDPGVDPGAVLTIFQRTRDNTSNEVVFFDVSNMFYGNRILPGSLTIRDTAISGTGGKVSITLKDDGNGNLYRADSKEHNATWSSVGNVFYNEGIISIKSPNIPFFGKDQFEIEFQGEQNIHMMRIHALARAGQINSSSNSSVATNDFPVYGIHRPDVLSTSPGFDRVRTVAGTEISASLNANETDESFVYITGLNFHDENLNVIMKTKFAQPVIKRNSDKILFKIKLDL